jgi:hypothetical protein
MAAGDWSNLSIEREDDTTFVQADVEGLGFGDVTASAGDVLDAYLSVTSEGYTGTTLGTRSRTPIPLIYRGVEAVAAGPFFDSFTDSDSTDLSSHTPDADTYGNGWTEESGTWVIQDNRLDVASGTGVATVDAGTPDIEMRFTCEADSFSLGAVIRFQDINNYLYLRVRRGTGIELYEKVAGVDNLLASDTLSFDDKDLIQVDVDAQADDDIVVTATRLADSSTATITQNTTRFNTATKFGVYTDSNSDYFDDFSLGGGGLTGSRVQLETAEPVYDDDASVTMSADEGAIPNSSVTTAALSDESVTNNSDLDYPTVTCHIISPMGWDRQAGAFDVWVEASGGFFPSLADPGEMGIATVHVEVDDGTLSETGTTTALALRARHNANGRWELSPGFKVSFDAADFGNKEHADITATAYPAVGDANSIRTNGRTIFVNKDDDYDTKVAYFDDSADVAGSGSGTFDDLEIVEQASTGATAVVWGAGQGGGGTLVIAGLRGTPDDSNVWTGDDSGATWTPSATPASNGSGTPALNDRDNPYGSMGAAAAACEAASSDGTASFSTLYAKTAFSVGPDLGFGSRPLTNDGPVWVEPDPMASDPTRLIIHGTKNSGGVRTACLGFRDLPAIREILNSTPQVSEELPGGGMAILLDNVSYDATKVGGTASGVAALTKTSNFAAGVFYTGCLLENYRTGTDFDSIVDCKILGHGEDPFTGSNNGSVTNSTVTTSVAGGAHSGCWQVSNAGNANRGLYFVDFSGIDTSTGDGAGTSAGALTLQAFDDELVSAAIVGCLFPEQARNTRREGDVDSLFQYHTVMLMQEDWAAPTAASNIFNYACVFGRIVESYDDLPRAAWRNCHEIVSSVLGSYGLDNTNGSDSDTLFTDPDNGDYTPKAGGVLLGRLGTRVMSLAANGQEIPESGGAIGALQSEVAEPGGGGGGRPNIRFNVRHDLRYNIRSTT